MTCLREARRKRNLTQAELAEAAKLTTATISRYETGRRRVSIKAAKVLGEVLGVHWYDLVEDDGDSGEGGENK